MVFVGVQFLNGISYASTLFLMAAGLTLIFGVTRIVNFAHGSFFMLGALVSAHLVGVWHPGWANDPWLYALAMLLGAGSAGLAGALSEIVLLRRMYAVPELYQLVATFGLSLVMHDAMQWAFGSNEIFAPRFPGLVGSVELWGEFFPQYQLVTIVLGPLAWVGLYLLLHRTGFGRQLRAATLDRGMLSALGVNPRPLMLGAVMLGCALAGLGGALQIPREPANLQMDVGVVVETFVVVVTGGLGSIAGAFCAALLIGLIHTFGMALVPQATLVLVFLTMAVVLVLRPQGLFGRTTDISAPAAAQKFHLPRPGWSQLGCVAVVALALGGWYGGVYWSALAADGLILLLFGLSLQSMMALGGLVSFGHAAYYALGAYGAALAHQHLNFGLVAALCAGCVLAFAVAAVFGTMVVRSAGVYLAMLSLAMAQIVWAIATQWISLSGGDNGLIGLHLVADDQQGLFLALLVALALGAVWSLQRLARSSFGAALQAVRDAPERAAASGLTTARIRYRIFVQSAVVAGLAGGLFAAHKGSVFPSVASVANSLDALLVVLMGGVHHLWGAVAGSVLLVWAAAELGRGFEYWRGALGLVVMLVMVLAPGGLLGMVHRFRIALPAVPGLR